MARIKLMQEIIKRRTEVQVRSREELSQFVLELILAGNNKLQVLQILKVREGLTPEETRELEAILETLL